MPKPVSPVLPGVDLPEVTFGAGQSEYKELPAYRDEEGAVLTRWRLTWRERLRILITGNLFVWLLTFNQPLQPISIQVDKPATEDRGGKPTRT